MNTEPIPGDQARQELDTVAQLRSEVDRLRRELDAADAPPRKGNRWRTFWSAVCIVLAVLLVPLSVVAVWARSEVTDTDRYVSTVAPLATDPAIQQAVSDRVTKEVLGYIDVPSLTADAIDVISANRDLNPKQTAALSALAGPLDSGIEGFVTDKVDQIVRSETFAAVWTEANTRAHTRLNQVLSGDTTGPVSIDGGDVTLDVGQVLAQVKQALIDRGFTLADKIPAVSSQMVIFQSDNLAAAQRGYAMLNTVGLWLPVIAAALALIGIFVANNWRRATLGLGIGLALSSLLSGILVGVGRMEYLNALPASVNKPAATAFFDTFSYYLRQTLWAAVAAAVVLILAAVLSGPTRFATGVRGVAVSSAAAIQRQLASWGATMTQVRRWVASNVGGLRLGAALLAFLYVVLTRYKTPGLVGWTTAALLVALFVIQILASGAADTDDGGSEGSGSTGVGSNGEPTAA